MSQFGHELKLSRCSVVLSNSVTSEPNPQCPSALRGRQEQHLGQSLELLVMAEVPELQQERLLISSASSSGGYQ